MREDGDASDKPLDIAVLSRMKQFRAMNKLKKVALKVSVVFLLLLIFNSYHAFLQHHTVIEVVLTIGCHPS